MLLPLKQGKVGSLYVRLVFKHAYHKYHSKCHCYTNPVVGVHSLTLTHTHPQLLSCRYIFQYNWLLNLYIRSFRYKTSELTLKVLNF